MPYKISTQPELENIVMLLICILNFSQQKKMKIVCWSKHLRYTSLSICCEINKKYMLINKCILISQRSADSSEQGECKVRISCSWKCMASVAWVVEMESPNRGLESALAPFACLAYLESGLGYQEKKIHRCWSCQESNLIFLRGSDMIKLQISLNHFGDLYHLWKLRHGDILCNISAISWLRVDDV